ncbi:MAG: winged helix-turn-helix domain-containing protein [Roseiarcus sp.]|uniref:winged helix-turn-helix domain-containing protein n=1 Tax=Roseiarcus sp. TaxID=1969460 RepID=UPI003BAFB850
MVDAPGFDGVNPSREAATPLRFAGLVLDLDACMLARESGEAVPLTRGEFAVLRMFVSRPGRVISRDALLDAFANRRFEPFDRSVDVLIGKLRRKIESDPKQPRLIVTVPGEGYRFDALRFRPPQIVELADSDTTAKPNGPSPPRLSMVVLPFANIGGDPEQEYFVDGATESLTTDLSRISGAFVIARNTAFAYKGKAGDVTQIGRELNVRYVLEGSVQRAGGRMRVNVQLIEAETGAHLWAERFDKPVADLFDMQDEIVSHLANRLGQELVRAEAGRAERVANPDSMDHYFLGLAHCHKGPTAEHLDQARSHFDRALELDPNNVGALVWRALADLWWVSSWLSEDQQERFRSAEADLRKALKLRPDDANAHNALGYLRILSNRAVQGISECERALSIDRNLANAHAMIGMGKYLAGRTEETEAHIVEALRISPRDNFAWVWMYIAGRAKVYAGCDEEAVVWLNRSIQLNPNTPVFHFMLAAALAHLGRIEDAREAARAGLELDPSFSSARLRRSMTFSDNPVFLAGRERAYEGMRLAGVPEG